MIKYYCDSCGKDITEGKTYAKDTYSVSIQAKGQKTKEDDYPSSFDLCYDCRVKMLEAIFGDKTE